MKRLIQILTKYNFPIRHSIQGIDEKLLQLENVLGQNLPSDYKYYLTFYQWFEADMDVQNVILWDIDEVIKLNSPEHSLSEYLNSILLIGGNGAGEYIAIDFRESSNQAILLCPAICIDDEAAYIHIGNSLTDMLLRLDARIDWFDD